MELELEEEEDEETGELPLNHGKVLRAMTSHTKTFCYQETTTDLSRRRGRTRTRWRLWRRRRRRKKRKNWWAFRRRRSWVNGSPILWNCFFFYFFTCFVHRTYCYVVLWKYEDRVIPARFLSEMKDRSALYLQ